MTQANKTHRTALLEAGLDQLHQESKEWQNDIDFLKTETGFIQKMLDQNALRTQQARHKKELEHIQNLLTYYKGEVLDELKHDIRKHEHKLAELLTTAESKVDENPYRHQHAELHDRINSFQNTYKGWKNDVYRFMETVE